MYDFTSYEPSDFFMSVPGSSKYTPPKKTMDRDILYIREVMESRLNIEAESPCGELIQTLYKSHTNKNKRTPAWSAVCFFYGAKIHKRGLSIKALCHLFQTNEKHFWNESKDSLEGWKETLSPRLYKDILLCAQDIDGITRLVHSIEIINDDETRWNVIKVAQNLAKDTRIQEGMQTVKTSCLMATLVYIAMQTQGIQIPKHKITSTLHISAVTLLKHELKIQSLLSASKS